jgi:O-antigen ligase
LTNTTIYRTVSRMKSVDFSQHFEKFGPALGMAAAFLLPLKLSLAYAALVPLLILWLISRPKLYPTDFGVTSAFIAFIGIAFLSSFFGIEPLRSLPKFLSLAFFSLSMLAFAQLAKSRPAHHFLNMAIAGQTLAALHSVLEGASFGALPRFFLGDVTESGQLALVIPVALGVATGLSSAGYDKSANKSLGRPALLKFPRVMAVGALNLSIATLMGFASSLQLNIWSILILAALLTLGCLAVLKRAINKPDLIPVLIIGIALPILVAALLINLKRGPWVGASIGLGVFLLVYARALLLPLIGALVVISLFVDPVKIRLAQSAEHFFISGGRSIMWEIGSELATRYPLGIGYHNSPFLRHFSMQIPPQHNHFHNNFLNILVETGWFGLTCFLWWLAMVIVTAFSRRGRNTSDIISCAIGCGIISWQVAGIVEYNFGDSEVVNIAYLLIGLLLASVSTNKLPAPPSPQSNPLPSTSPR